MSQNPVIIYSSHYCGYCRRAKALLDSLGVTYQEIIVDGQPALRQQMEQLSGRHTVPQVFVAGQSLGGSSDLYALHKRGELVPQIFSDSP